MRPLKYIGIPESYGETIKLLNEYIWTNWVVFETQQGKKETRDTKETERLKLPLEVKNKPRRTQQVRGLSLDGDQETTLGVLFCSLLTPERWHTEVHRKICGTYASKLESTKYKTDTNTKHEPKKDGTNLYRVRWYKYEEDEEKLEPIYYLPCIKVVKYYRMDNLEQKRDFSKEGFG